MAAKAFDYIIVGGGTAACILARRLVDANVGRVLLLEEGAGAEETPAEVTNPQSWFKLFGSKIDRGYFTVPQPGLMGRSVAEPRAKLIGGCSNMYLMMHLRGHPADYDRWAYDGCMGWSYQELQKYFQAVEGCDDDSNPWGGREGLLSVQNAKNHRPHELSTAFVESCASLGYKRTSSFNGPDMEGTGWHQVNLKDGKRHVVYDAYLKPVLGNPLLTVQTGAKVTRLLIERGRCTGVQYTSEGVSRSVNAEREVVVCAGAIDTPKILMLSGIGDPAELSQHGISVRNALSGVGKNFMNHVLTGIVAECPRAVGPGYQNLSECAVFTKSSPGVVGVDIQINFVHMPFTIIFGKGDPNGMTMIPGLERPYSRGWIRLKSASPDDAPLINPNYYGCDADIQRMVKAVKICREIYAASPMKEMVREETAPGLSVSTDKDIESFLRQTSESYHHQCGTCKMGVDEQSVVDPMLRVHGMTGVRVIDASVIPVIPSANIHTAVCVIAEKGADMIISEKS